MLVHQKNLDLQIGKDIINDQFSDLKINIPSCFIQQFQSQKQSKPPFLNRNSPTQRHLHINIQSFSANSSSQSDQNEPTSQNHSTTKTLLSAPHKRPIMSQSSSLPRSPTISSLHRSHQLNPEVAAASAGSVRGAVQAAFPLQTCHYHQKASLSNSDSSRQSLLCAPSFPVILATKRITFKLIRHSCHASWLRVQLKVFILFSLPSVYFFTSTKRWPALLYILYVLAFSPLLIVLLKFSLPRFPSIRLFLARISCIKLSSLTTPTKHHSPVIWSIGSKPKSERRPKPNSGSWVQVYSNGDVYEGEFHKGKCSGSGVYYYHLSGRYEGDWIDGNYDGYGIETWSKGSWYRGQYRQGLRHGIGLYRSYTGDIYSGEWCNGQCHGCGVHTCKDGSSYVGELKWGAKHGLGHYQFRNRDTYAGEYFADKVHGFGVYHFGNGHRYEGAWHEGRRQGFGTYTFRSGETQSGHWQNGVLNASSIRGTLTGSSSLVDHPRVLHAVQEARIAAEKATELANLDERVKRAIAAANKAATTARVAAVKAVQNQMLDNNSYNTSFPVV